MRPSKRKNNELRNIHIETDISMHAEGSCLINFGNTKVLCAASVDSNIPPFLRDKKQGWITAEYSMLPRATNLRSRREASLGKLSGRTNEIQRLIARSLRAAVDLKLLGERQIIIDCDVIQADGGTRTAAITGGYIALYLACKNLLRRKLIKSMPIVREIAAISAGIYKNQVIIDLDYIEDSNAEVDANFILDNNGKIIEFQGTAEQDPFELEHFIEMFKLARSAIFELTKLQKIALGI